MNIVFKPKCLTYFLKNPNYEIFNIGEEYEENGEIHTEKTRLTNMDKESYGDLFGNFLWDVDGEVIKDLPMYIRLKEKEIENFMLNKSSSPEIFNPLEDSPNLYTEIAKIEYFDTSTLKKFIDNFGIPWGEDFLSSNIYTVFNYEMDLFPFYKHLFRYKKALDIYGALNNNDKEKIEGYAYEYAVFMMKKDMDVSYGSAKRIISENNKNSRLKDEIIQKMANKIALNGPKILFNYGNVKNSSPEIAAKNYLIELLNNQEKGNDTFAVVDGKIQPATTFKNLLEVAYFQLSRAVTGNVDMDRCKNCNALFEIIHGAQNFCPPLPGHKISSCQNTYNQRMKRKRKKEKTKAEELAPKGFSPQQIAEELEKTVDEIKEWINS